MPAETVTSQTEKLKLGVNFVRMQLV